jgi:integrase
MNNNINGNVLRLQSYRKDYGNKPLSYGNDNTQVGYLKRCNELDYNELLKYLKVDMRLMHNTALTYIRILRGYLRNREFNENELRDFLLTVKNPYTYNNYLKSFIAYSRYIGVPFRFKFAQVDPKLRLLPTKKQLSEFYNLLDTDYERLLFIGYASSGLRRTELLEMKMKDIDFDNHAFIPNHNSTTKHSYYSFYNKEFEKVLPSWIRQRYPKSEKLFCISGTSKSMIFYMANKKSDIEILV